MSLKRNMEICYVPVAKLKDVQEMMADWNQNNKYVRFSAIGAIAISLWDLYYLSASGEGAAIFLCIISMLIMALEAVIVTKSLKWIYYLSYFGTMMFSFSASFIDFEEFTLPSAIAMSVPHLINTYFAYRAIYNYDDVYLKLKARKGFPYFIFSTSDMYADKIYLKNKEEKTVAEKRVEASFNPFNEEYEITDEEVKRMNSLRYEELKKLTIDVFEGVYHEAKEIKRSFDERKKYKYRFRVLGIDIIIPHDDIETSTTDEKRKLLRLWNDLKANMFKHELYVLMFMVGLILVANLGGMGLGAAVYFLAVIGYVLGTNLIKLEKPIGFFVTVISVFSYIFAMGGNVIASGFIIIGMAYFSVAMLPWLIKWIINYPVYKKLSKEKGFPSFIEHASDLYGDEMYILEEQKPIVKGEKLEPIIMNIGYDEDEKKYKNINTFDYHEKNKGNMSLREDKGWNAFDYLDKDKDNSAYDDFVYYEQAYEARKNAKPLEEKQKPNKDMGRNTYNEN